MQEANPEGDDVCREVKKERSLRLDPKNND
jgi:hypothetical protein